MTSTCAQCRPRDNKGNANCAGALNIGCEKDMTSDTFWTGQIDDVHIHSRDVRP